MADAYESARMAHEIGLCARCGENIERADGDWRHTRPVDGPDHQAEPHPWTQFAVAVRDLGRTVTAELRRLLRL